MLNFMDFDSVKNIIKQWIIYNIWFDMNDSWNHIIDIVKYFMHWGWIVVNLIGRDYDD